MRFGVLVCICNYLYMHKDLYFKRSRQGNRMQVVVEKENARLLVTSDTGFSDAYSKVAEVAAAIVWWQWQ